MPHHRCKCRTHSREDSWRAPVPAPTNHYRLEQFHDADRIAEILKRHRYMKHQSRRRRSPHLGAHALSGRRSQGAPPTAPPMFHLDHQEPDSTTAACSGEDSGEEEMLPPPVSTPHRLQGQGPMRADHSLFQQHDSYAWSQFADSSQLSADSFADVSLSSELRKRPFSALGAPVPAQLPKAACVEVMRPLRPASCAPCIVTNPRYRRRSVEPPPPSDYETPLSPPRASRLPPPPPHLDLCPPPPPPPPPVMMLMTHLPSPNICSPTAAVAARHQDTEKRRRSGGRILLDSLRRSAKKTAASLRRAVSTERLVPDENDSSFASTATNTTLPAAALQPEALKKVTRRKAPGSLKRLARRFSVGGKENNPATAAPNATTEASTKSSTILQRHADGSKTVRLGRIGPRRVFGFYVAKGNRNFSNGIFVSRVSADMMGALAGLVSVGDEILEVEGRCCRRMELDEVYSVIGSLESLQIRVMPYLARRDAV